MSKLSRREFSKELARRKEELKQLTKILKQKLEKNPARKKKTQGVRSLAWEINQKLEELRLFTKKNRPEMYGEVLSDHAVEAARDEFRKIFF